MDLMDHACCRDNDTNHQLTNQTPLVVTSHLDPDPSHDSDMHKGRSAAERARRISEYQESLRNDDDGRSELQRMPVPQIVQTSTAERPETSSIKKSKLMLAEIRHRQNSILASSDAVVKVSPPTSNVEVDKINAQGVIHTSETDIVDQIQSQFSNALSLSPLQGIRRTQQSDTPEFYNTGRYFQNATKFKNILSSSLVSSFNGLLQNLFHRSSQAASGSSLVGSKQVREHILQEVYGSKEQPRVDSAATKHSPKDIRTVYKIFDNLEPDVTVYATCPDLNCCSLYPPTLHKEDIPEYPLQCTEVRYGKPCGASLAGDFTSKGGKVTPAPIKPYSYHHFNDHVAAMLSRPGIEVAIESYMRKSCTTGSSPLETELADIMGSSELRDFLDRSGEPFLRTTGTELRLVWSLATDWYNPHTNKASGKIVSTGVVGMICLSLPPDIRYSEENIYLCGIIPGPQEPALDAINPFITPLMHDLNTSYHPGTYFSRTFKYANGRVCRSAVIPLIADTLASKKVTGHISHSSNYFCSRCRLPRNQIHNLNCGKWPPALSRAEHIIHAEEWKAASSFKKQELLARKNGVRWSALLLLPYWQPSRWAITDGLHVLLLGVVPRHCRDLLGLNMKGLPSEQDDDNDEPSPPPILMDKARTALSTGSPSQLHKFDMKTLSHLCKERDVFVPLHKNGRRKKDYIGALLGQDVSSKGLSLIDLPENMGLSNLLDGGNTPSLQAAPGTMSTEADNHSAKRPTKKTKYKPIPIITKEMLSRIRQDSELTLRPSWQANLPKEFGSPSHGKLKADQWRTVIEFDLPVSLIQILATQKPSGSLQRDSQLHKLVILTVDLAMALSWGLSRRTSNKHIDKYTMYMSRYLSGVQDLFPDYALKPVHHYALHMQDILRLFGPLHGTWAFPLERLIGVLQKFKTNSKPGEMEETAMRTFCRRSNLIRWVGTDDCPPALQEAWKEFNTKRRNLESGELAHQLPELETDLPYPQIDPLDYLCPDICRLRSRETLTADMEQSFIANFTPSRIPGSNLYFSPHSIEVFSSFYRGSLQFSDYLQSEKHSVIYFRPNSESQDLAPAQIRRIFRHTHLHGPKSITDIFAVVHCYIPIKLAKDPFAPYVDFRAAIFATEPSPTFHIIKSSQIHCHANRRPWDTSSVAMRAVDRNY